MRTMTKRRASARVLTIAAFIAAPTALTVGADDAVVAAASSSPNTDNGTITWTGNGTTAGTCTDEEDLGVTVADGQQAWLFILTSPGSSPYELTTNLGDTTGTQQGQGSVHFVLVTPLHAVLTSASAVTGTNDSVLTVSGCQFGAPITTATTTPTTTGGGTTGGGTTGGGVSTGGGGTTGVGGTTGPGATGGVPGVSTSPGSLPQSASPTSGGSTPTSSAGLETAAPAATRPGIAFTGANVTGMLATALFLIAAGSALVFGSRRRRRRQAA